VSGTTTTMDSSAFDAIKNSAITLVSQKLETQREVERLRGDVAAAYDQIKESRTTINKAYEQGSNSFFDWQDLARKRTAAQNNSLMLLNKANTMWELAKMPSGGRVHSSKENRPAPALNSSGSARVIDFTCASIDAIEKEIEVRASEQFTEIASLQLPLQSAAPDCLLATTSAIVLTLCCVSLTQRRAGIRALPAS
jgi:hypothetical protein